MCAVPRKNQIEDPALVDSDSPELETVNEVESKEKNEDSAGHSSLVTSTVANPLDPKTSFQLETQKGKTHPPFGNKPNY
jgi:hypothetical protein